MSVSIRPFRHAGLCLLLAACQDRDTQNDLDALDARLTNGAAAGVIEARSAAEREAQAAAGGRIEAAPAAKAPGEADGASVTLGDMARRQAAGRASAVPAAVAGGNCADSVVPGKEWAQRMPAPFRLYPRAQLLEAAGNQTDRCKLRVISFTTDVPVESVLGYYYTQAKRAGYDAEHLLVRNEHQLGGTRGDLAYVVFARGERDGRTSVDIIANVN